MTDAEKEFLSMAKMAGIDIDELAERKRAPYVGHTVASMLRLDPCLKLTIYDHQSGVQLDPQYLAFMTTVDVPMLVARRMFEHHGVFGVVASTFATLCEERPELREHFDRAKEAWEASQ